MSNDSDRPPGPATDQVVLVLAARIMDEWIQEGLISDADRSLGTDPEWRKAKHAVMTMLGFVPAHFDGTTWR